MNAWGSDLNAWGIAFAWLAVQVGLFLLAGAAVYAVVRRRNPAAGAWALAAVLIATLGLSAIAPSPWPRWGSADALWQHAARFAATLGQPDELPPQSKSLVTAEPTVDWNDNLPARELPAPKVEAEAATWQQRLSQLQPELSRAETADGWRWPAWLAAIVLSCIVLGTVRVAVAWVLAQRFAKRAALIEAPAMQSLLQEIQEQLGQARRVEVRESNRLGSPCTLGWFRPQIVLPADWRSWSPAELRSVLAHELAHVARGDFAIGLLAQVGVLLHFYNPLVWWLVGRLRLEQEMAADLLGAKLAGGRQVYLATIARMALRQNHLPLMARPFLPTRGTLLRRVEMLHKETRLPESSISWSVRMAVAMLLLLAGGLLAGVRGPSDSVAKADSPPAKEAEPVTTDERKLLVGASKGYQSAHNRMLFLKRNLRDALKLRRQNKESLTPETEQAVSDARQKVLEAELALAEMESDLRLDGEADESKRHTAARQAHLRNASAEKLKSLWVALNNYVDIHRQFPPPVEMGPDGKTPHSWRVTLLRFLDDDLYDRYRLNEPWDSEHNRQIIAAGADLFSVPAESPSNDCGYFVIVGPGLMFDPARATGYREVKDGTAQTVAIVEAKRPVPWTKPEDVVLTNDAAPSKLGGLFPGGFHALFLNGNIHFLSDDLDPAVVKALATLAGGEELAFDRATNRLKLKPAAATSDAQRVAILREKSVNRLKHLGIAFLNYHDVNKRFPAAVEIGPDGKTPHSWRVAILPYIAGKGEELSKRYRLNEPWDSEHNKQVIADGADLFAVPAEAPATDCGYFVLTGPGSAFDPEVPANTIRTIRDGTSKTIAVVEAKRSIPWTKPEDLGFSADKPLPKLGGFFEGGFNSLFLDASVHFIPQDTKDDALRALISGSGREIIDIDSGTGRVEVNK